MGNLVATPELKYVGENKTPKSVLRLAINRKFKGKEETTFIDCETWGKNAENAVEFTKKGEKIILSGDLRQDNWEHEGVKRTKHYINVDFFRMLGSKPQSQNEDVSESSDLPEALTE